LITGITLLPVNKFLDENALAQAISPIATQISVAWSVVVTFVHPTYTARQI